MQNKNKSRLGPPRSPALLVVGLYNLCSHLLLIMLTIIMIACYDLEVLVFRKSIENCSYRHGDDGGI